MRPDRLPDPLARLEEFRPHDGPVLDLPTVTLVMCESRPDEAVMNRMRRISRWHRRFMRPAHEVWFTSVEPRLDHVEWRRIEPWVRFPIDYSTWCLTRLWREVETEHILIAQWDGFALDPTAWTDEFLSYDWIGGPTWSGRTMVADGRRIRADVVGNGGFCLRSRRLAMATEALVDERHPDAPWEDAYVCLAIRRELESRGMRWPSEQLAWRFAQNYHEGISVRGRFGFHGATNLEQVTRMLERNWL